MLLIFYIAAGIVIACISLTILGFVFAGLIVFLSFKGPKWLRVPLSKALERE
jgi:hypothetical protein